MDHTTFFPIPAPARYSVVGSPGNVANSRMLPRHSMEAWMRRAVIPFLKTDQSRWSRYH